MQMDQAKSVLRLQQDAPCDSATVAAAFHKMARRYPVEQFPERFSELRQAFELLSNPVSALRSLVFDSNPDLSGILPPLSSLNEKPQSDTERKVLQQLRCILRYAPQIISEAVEDDAFFDGFENDLKDADLDLDFEKILEEMTQMLMGPGGSKKGKKRR